MRILSWYISPALAFAFLLLGSAAAEAEPSQRDGNTRSPPKPAPRFIRGMALGHYTDIAPKRLQRKLEEIKGLGATHVSVVVSWSMRDVRSNRIRRRANHTTPDSTLVRIVRAAHEEGLEVLLFPILDIERRRPLEWRGKIRPRNWSAWWQDYGRYIRHYATLARKTGIALFCVGSELVSTETQRDRWAALIKEVRSLYPGELIYSANWDHYKPVSFWPLVDRVGLTAYYGLTKNNEAPMSEMITAWAAARSKLVAWAKKHSYRFIFTEVGYPSQDGGAVNPWDYTQGTGADVEEQRRAYEAFVKTWHGVEPLAGVFFWDWYGEGGPRDTTFTPRGKPAAKVIRRWFHAVAQRVALSASDLARN